MKKRKFITAVLMLISLISSNLQAKSVKNKKAARKEATKGSNASKKAAEKKASLSKTASTKSTKVTKNKDEGESSKTTSSKSMKSTKKETAKDKGISRKTLPSKANSVSKISSAAINKKRITPKVSATAMKRNSKGAKKGIYTIPSNNSNALLESKMTQLKDRHRRISSSGSTNEKKSATVEQRLLASYNRWRGTRYTWGGDSKRGIDCSALTRRIYREVFGYELPRVSTQQVQRGTRVSSSSLRPGDILFFRPEGRTNHTAVYVGNSLFINASSSKGVVLSSLKSPYWARYFKYGVRVNTNT